MKMDKPDNFSPDSKFNMLLWYLVKIEALLSGWREGLNENDVFAIRLVINKLQLELNLIFDEYYLAPGTLTVEIPYLTKAEVKELRYLCRNIIICINEYTTEKNYALFNEQLNRLLKETHHALLEALMYSI